MEPRMDADGPIRIGHRSSRRPAGRPIGMEPRIYTDGPICIGHGSKLAIHGHFRKEIFHPCVSVSIRKKMTWLMRPKGGPAA